MDARRAEPREHGAMEDPEQLAAVDGELRPAVAGGQAARLAPDPLPVPGVEDELGGGDADRGQVVEEAELGQLAHGVGQDVDADAQLLHGRGRLVDLDVVEAGVVEREGQRHAADAAPDDGDLHVGFSVHPGPAQRARARTRAQPLRSKLRMNRSSRMMRHGGSGVKWRSMMPARRH